MENKLKLDSKIIKTETRTIKASWSRKLASDLQSYHNIDALAELEKILNTDIRCNIRKKKIENILKHID